MTTLPVFRTSIRSCWLLITRLLVALCAASCVKVSTEGAETPPLPYRFTTDRTATNYHFKFAIVDANNGQTIWTHDGSLPGNLGEPVGHISVDLPRPTSPTEVLLGDGTNTVLLPAPDILAAQPVFLRIWVRHSGDPSFKLRHQDLSRNGFQFGAVIAHIAKGLVANAVTTPSIADGAITRDKLSDDVRRSLTTSLTPKDGLLGFGTAAPATQLHVYSEMNSTVLRLQSAANGFGTAGIDFWSGEQGQDSEWRPAFMRSIDHGDRTGGLAFSVNGSGAANRETAIEVMRLVDGRVGISTTSPRSTLDLGPEGDLTWGASQLRSSGGIELGDSISRTASPYIDFHLGVGVPQDYNVRLINDAANTLSIKAEKVIVAGRLSADSIEVRGGSDFAERYLAAPGGSLTPGMVVAYSEDGSQRLEPARESYSPRVAGVVSGAKGIKPGVSLGQSGTALDGDIHVAMMGRVYVLCDTIYGPIKVGDLLTSSPIPGVAQRADPKNAPVGTVIGKATENLPAGRGLVLMHVLQR